MTGIDQQSLGATQVMRSRRPNLDFSEMGIEVGEAGAWRLRRVASQAVATAVDDAGRGAIRSQEPTAARTKVHPATANQTLRKQLAHFRLRVVN